MTDTVPSTALIATRGDTFRKRITLTVPVLDEETGEPVLDEDGNPTEEPYDLTDCILWFTVKLHKNDDDDDAVIAAYWEDEWLSSLIAVDDPTTGIMTVLVPKETMKDIAMGRYYYDVQLLDAAEDNTTIHRGTFDVDWDITRRTTVG